MNLSEEIVTALHQSLGSGNFGLHEPLFVGNEAEYLLDCLESTYVSSVGEYVNRFELLLRDYTEADHVVAVMNGTAALHIALMLAGVGEGDEVLVPTFTFVATANAVRYVRAIPHFIDSDAQCFGADAFALREWLNHCAESTLNGCRNKKTGNRIRAIIPMHVYGHPCDMDSLLAVAHDFQLTMVEDAAESLGSYYCGRHTGTFGKLGIISFNGNKTITCGGGGAILTNDRDLARKAKHLTTTAKTKHSWAMIHDEVGYNYRLPNLNAALGCAQLEQLPQFLASKKALYQRYLAAFENFQSVALLSSPNNTQSNFWLQTLVMDESVANERDNVLRVTNELGYGTRPAWELMHKLPMFRDFPRGPVEVAEAIQPRIINLPSNVIIA